MKQVEASSLGRWISLAIGRHYNLATGRSLPRNKTKRVHKVDIETLTIIDTYESLKEAGRINGVARSSISRVCNNKSRSAVFFGK
jgi:hypothetical protein